MIGLIRVDSSSRMFGQYGATRLFRLPVVICRTRAILIGAGEATSFIPSAPTSPPRSDNVRAANVIEFVASVSHPRALPRLSRFTAWRTTFFSPTLTEFDPFPDIV